MMNGLVNCGESPKKPKKAIVLLSGGMDSAVVLAMAQNMGFTVHGLTFRYGQRHHIEIKAAEIQARLANIEEHTVFDLDLSQFGGSFLTSKEKISGRFETEEQGQKNISIPPTYVPARNTVFLSVALSLAEATQAKDIFIGVSSVDYSGYPDCRPEFIKSFEQLANLGTKAADSQYKFKIHAPLLHLTKAQTVLEGLKLGVDFGQTRTCYDPDEQGMPCGLCASCQLRIKGFEKLGIEDPSIKTKI